MSYKVSCLTDLTCRIAYTACKMCVQFTFERQLVKLFRCVVPVEFSFPCFGTRKATQPIQEHPRGQDFSIQDFTKRDNCVVRQIRAIDEVLEIVFQKMRMFKDFLTDRTIRFEHLQT